MDHPDCLFELKHDGFRALAYVDGHQCRLVSRSGHTFSKWDVLCTEISHSIRAHDAVLDGEIVCLDANGRTNFYKLLFRRDWPYFFAFDLLSVDGEDLRAKPLLERKRRLKRIMPRIESRLLFVDHVSERGIALFREACRKDLDASSRSGHADPRRRVSHLSPARYSRCYPCDPTRHARRLR